MSPVSGLSPLVRRFSFLPRQITAMLCNLKICRLRRRAVGSFFLLLILCGVVLTYAALLRSSKSVGSTFRLQKKHSHHKNRKMPGGGSARGHPKTKTPASPLTSSELPIYIVEEHQEVLPYWIESANNGIISKTGNTLIHIDANADSNMPLNIPGYPFFRWPRRNQLEFMTQNSDSYIMTAITSDLFNRYVWIWPKWDSKNHNETYRSAFAHLGWAKIDEPKKTAGKMRAFCACISHEKTSPPKKCSVYSFVNSTRVEKTILPSHCHLKRTVKLEKVREDIAIDKFKHGSWVRKSENVVLDLDEDFLGYESVLSPLVAAGMSLVDIAQVSKDVQRIICPRAIEEEVGADKLLARVLNEIYKLRRSFCSKMKADTCRKFASIGNFSSVVRMFNNALNTFTPSLACKKKATLKYIHKFVQKLALFKEKQLLALREVGFCFSPLVKSFGLEYRFQLCYGGSILNGSLRHIHSTHQKDVAMRIMSLQKLLDSSILQPKPRIVTLVRSVRCGFIPRKYFHKIEKDIMSRLRNLHPKVKVYYDSGLLGGKSGWPRRHSQNMTFRPH